MEKAEWVGCQTVNTCIDFRTNLALGVDGNESSARGQHRFLRQAKDGSGRGVRCHWSSPYVTMSVCLQFVQWEACYQKKEKKNEETEIIEKERETTTTTTSMDDKVFPETWCKAHYMTFLETPPLENLKEEILFFTQISSVLSDTYYRMQGLWGWGLGRAGATSQRICRCPWWAECHASGWVPAHWNLPSGEHRCQDRCQQPTPDWGASAGGEKLVLNSCSCQGVKKRKSEFRLQRKEKASGMGRVAGGRWPLPAIRKGAVVWQGGGPGKKVGRKLFGFSVCASDFSSQRGVGVRGGKSDSRKLSLPILLMPCDGREKIEICLRTEGRAFQCRKPSVCLSVYTPGPTGPMPSSKVFLGFYSNKVNTRTVGVAFFLLDHRWTTVSCCFLDNETNKNVT